MDVPAGLGPLADAEPGTVAEGAFLLALTRASVARRHGWPVHAEIPRGPRVPDSARRPGSRNLRDSRGSRDSRGHGGGTSFLAADAVVALLAAVYGK
jgi:hypothetical protein